MNRHARKLRKQAARATLRRIRADKQRASPEVKTALTVIEKRLFNHDFDANCLWHEIGLKRWVAERFCEELGTGPGGYISNGRLEVGAVLLARTPLRVFEIAEVLGYSAARDTFSKAFRRWSGQAPRDYRLEAQANGEPKLVENEPAVVKLIDEIDRASGLGDLAGMRHGLAQADAFLRDYRVTHLAGQLALSLHERGAQWTRTGYVDRAYDDLSLARRCYAAAGDLPPAIVRLRRSLPVSHETDKALLSTLCPDCRQRLVADEGRSMRQNLRQALLMVPRDDPWLEASCDDCYRVAWTALSRARLGLMSDAWKAWWLSSHVDPKDPECPPSRGRFIAAMAEVERLNTGDQLERKGFAELAVEDAVALGDPMLEAEARLWLSAVLGAMTEFADAKEQINSAGESGGSRWLSALRDRAQGLLEFHRRNHSTALVHLESGSELYCELDPHVSGLLVIQQANVQFDLADYKRSIALNQRALHLLDGRRDSLPQDGIIPIHLASAFGLLGRWDKAEIALSRCRFDHHVHLGLAATEIITRACLELLRGHIRASVDLFSDARDRFSKLNRPRAAALAASYSVEAYVRLGRPSRAVEIAVAALALFQAAGCSQDTLDTLEKLRALLDLEVIDTTAVAARVRHLARQHGGWLPDVDSGWQDR